jgi:hypothetical protein
LQKIAEQEAAKAAKEAVALKPLGDALDQWLAGYARQCKTRPQCAA